MHESSNHENRPSCSRVIATMTGNHAWSVPTASSGS